MTTELLAPLFQGTLTASIVIYLLSRAIHWTKRARYYREARIDEQLYQQEIALKQERQNEYLSLINAYTDFEIRIYQKDMPISLTPITYNNEICTSICLPGTAYMTVKGSITEIEQKFKEHVQHSFDR